MLISILYSRVVLNRIYRSTFPFHKIKNLETEVCFSLLVNYVFIMWDFLLV